MIDHFVCSECGATSVADPAVWRCPTCGGPLDLPELAIAAVAGPSLLPAWFGLWRYERWLPIRASVSLGESWTSLVRHPWHGIDVAWKVEGGLPSGSFKDRGSATLVSWLVERGVDRVVDDSSGNAGASLAAYCARARIQCEVHVPASASPAKLRQLEAYGARLVLVPGPRREATLSAMAAAGDAVYASHLWNPLFLAGTATFAWEAWEQLGRTVPEAVVMPLGGGTLLLGAYRGFAALTAAGLASRMPRLYGVQSARCAPILAAMDGAPAEAADAPAGSLAEGVLVARPPRAAAIIEAVRASGGSILAVDDTELAAAHVQLARAGLDVEPTSALSASGVERLAAAGAIRPGEVVVAALTGSGLKTPPGLKAPPGFKAPPGSTRSD